MIGRGGRSFVHRAHPILGSPSAAYLPDTIALKVYTSGGKQQDDETLAHLKHEVQALHLCQSPHVIELFDYVATSSTCYLALEYAPFGDLGKILRRSPSPIAPARAVNYIAQAAKALAAVHGAGVVHCDIKPENLLVTGVETVKLSDFTIALLPGEKNYVQRRGNGTVGYLSPEFLLSGAVGPELDLYALAVTFYQLLTKNFPFESASMAEKVQRQLAGDRTPLSEYFSGGTEKLEAFFDRALAPLPEKRFRTAAEFLQALEALVPQSSKKRLSYSIQKARVSPVAPSAPGEFGIWADENFHRRLIRTAGGLVAAFLFCLAMLTGRSSANASFPRSQSASQIESLWSQFASLMTFSRSASVDLQYLTSYPGRGVLSGLFADGENTPMAIRPSTGDGSFIVTLGVAGFTPQTVVVHPDSPLNEIRLSGNGLRLSLYLQTESLGATSVLSGRFREHNSGREGRWNIDLTMPRG